MSTVTFAVLAISIQGVFVLLDLIDWHRKPRSCDGPPDGIGTWLFLVTVIAFYFVLQFGGYLLVPQTRDLLAMVRESVAASIHHNTAGLPMNAWQTVGVSVTAFYVTGLWDYLINRFFSHNRWFFFTHEYHHLPRQVTCLMPGIAGRPFAVFAVFPTIVASALTVYALLAVCGLPLWDLSALKVLLLVILAVQVAGHSSYMRRQWWMHDLLKRLAITSPQEHVLHHAAELYGNFGNITTLWDRLLGTYLDPRLPRYRDPICGLSYDQDFLGTITLGRLKLPRTWRQRFHIARFCNIADKVTEKR